MGVIIGVAFGKVVTSVVNDIIMPPIGKIMGGVNFADLFINLDPSKLAKDGSAIKSLAQAKEAGAAVIAYTNVRPRYRVEAIAADFTKQERFNPNRSLA